MQILISWSILLGLVFLVYKLISNYIKDYKSCPKNIRDDIEFDLCKAIDKDLKAQGYMFWEFSHGMIKAGDSNYDNSTDMLIYQTKYTITTSSTMSQIARGLLEIRTDKFQAFGIPLLKKENGKLFPLDYIDFYNPEEKYIIRIFLKQTYQYSDEYKASYKKSYDSGKDFKGFFN